MIFGTSKQLFVKTFWFKEKLRPETCTVEIVEWKKGNSLLGHSWLRPCYLLVSFPYCDTGEKMQKGKISVLQKTNAVSKPDQKQ